MVRAWTSYLPTAVGLALGLALAGSAAAGTVSGWWGGAWRCNIDGRAAEMHWFPVTVDEGSCNGDTCTSAVSARWQGRFSDSGSAWVPLSNASAGSGGGLYFNHADGNRWYLATPVGNVAEGYTTWNGQRYALSCWR